MQLGIFAKTFSEIGAANVLNAVSRSGFSCTQFNMACVGIASLPDEIPASMIDEISAAQKSSGVAITAISATYNMIHPNLDVRKGGMRKLEVIMKAARSLDVNLVTLCTGTCDPDDQWRHHPDNQSEHSWRSLRGEMDMALALAEKYHVTLGVEPELGNVVNSAAAARRLLDETKSKFLKIVFDPVNLFEAHETSQQKEIVSSALDILQGSITMAHAKDRTAQGRIIAVGRGAVDFLHFIKCLKATGFNGPLITHGLHANEASNASRFLKSVIAEI